MADEATDVAIPDVMDVQDAAEVIGKLNLFGPPDVPAADPVQPIQPRDKQTGKFVKKDPPVESPQEVPQDESAETTEESPADEDTEQQLETDEAPPPKFMVKVDGQEVEVDETELKAGYSRTQDYTRKTQALAREREKFEKEELAAIREERRQLGEKLQALSALIPDPGAEPNWTDLRTKLTPEEFTDRFTEYRDAQQRLALVREHQAALLEKVRADEQRVLETQLRQAHSKLGNLIPEWKDAEKGDALRNDLVAYAKSEAYGYTDDDLAYITDPRLVVILNKARLYDESQKRRTTLVDKVDKALVAKPSAPVAPRAKEKVIEESISRLQRSGSVDDAADLIGKLGVVKPRTP